MRRVLVTRPQPGASATAKRLVEIGYVPVVLPLSEIVSVVPGALPADVDAIVATSANAFRHMPDRFLETLAGIPLYVVGARTADVAARDVTGIAPDGRALAAMLGDRLEGSAHVLHLTGRVRRPELKILLEMQGHRVTEIELYDARAAQLSGPEIGTKLGVEPFWAALVYSQRGAELLGAIALMAPVLFARTVFICISGDAAHKLGSRDVALADTPDEAGLLARLDGLAAGSGRRGRE